MLILRWTTALKLAAATVAAFGTSVAAHQAHVHAENSSLATAIIDFLQRYVGDISQSQLPLLCMIALALLPAIFAAVAISVLRIPRWVERLALSLAAGTLASETLSSGVPSALKKGNEQALALGFIVAHVVHALSGALGIGRNSHEHSHGHSTPAPAATDSKSSNSNAESRKGKNSRQSCGDSDSRPKAALGAFIVNGAIHAAAHGAVAGAAFFNGVSSGVATCVVLTLHEIPHRVADCAILKATGVRIQSIIFTQTIIAAASLGGSLIPTLAAHSQVESAVALTTGVMLHALGASVLPVLAESAVDDGLQSKETFQRILEIAVFVLGASFSLSS